MSVVPFLGHWRYLRVLQLASSWQSWRVEGFYNFIPIWIFWICWAVSNGNRCLDLGNCVYQCTYQNVHFEYLHFSLCTWIWIMPNKSGLELRYKTRCPDSQPWTLTELGLNFILLGSWLPIFFIPEPPELIILTLGGGRNIINRKSLFKLNLTSLKILFICCWTCIWRQSYLYKVTFRSMWGPLYVNMCRLAYKYVSGSACFNVFWHL